MKNKIFIIHGWTYSIKPWISTVSVLKSRNIETIQLKVPGLTKKSDDIYTIDDYVDWLHEELKDEKNPIIIAHSNGGRIALNYLNKYPNSFSKLILIGSAGIYDEAGQTSFRNQALMRLSKMFKLLKKQPLIRKVVYKLIGASDYNEAPENMKQTLKNMLDSDKDLAIKDNGVETVLLWGEKDDATPLWMGQKMHKKLANSRLKTFKNWGHAPYITHPYELANELEIEVVK